MFLGDKSPTLIASSWCPLPDSWEAGWQKANTAFHTSYLLERRGRLGIEIFSWSGKRAHLANNSKVRKTLCYIYKIYTLCILYSIFILYYIVYTICTLYHLAQRKDCTSWATCSRVPKGTSYSASSQWVGLFHFPNSTAARSPHISIHYFYTPDIIRRYPFPLISSRSSALLGGDWKRCGKRNV